MTTFNTLRNRADPVRRDRFRGCLLAGAAGDALGAAVEFDSRRKILQRFGAGGIRDFGPAYGRFGAITDDTQMTLFTAEGLLRAYVRWTGKGICHTPGVIAHAYQRWLATQEPLDARHAVSLDGWLIGQRPLHQQRAPGRTCLTALRTMAQRGEPADNDSKGCGGVMRVAPIGLFGSHGMLPGKAGQPGSGAFELAVEAAALTHGHRSGQLPAGLLAAIIELLIHDASLPDAIDAGLALLAGCEQHEETTTIVRLACELARQPSPPSGGIPQELGEGWVAEEALAIALYAALVAPDLESAVILAVNHDGDSDSTGAIAGNLLGARHGTAAIPQRWLLDLELRDVITDIADDLAAAPHWALDAGAEWKLVSSHYPGH